MIRKLVLTIVFTICIFSFSSVSAQLFGGQIKSNKDWSILYPAGSVFCASGPTAIVDVTNPITGKIWMDRNLGATQAATSSTDAAAYGDLYQWGRRSDGHQCRTSATTTTLSSIDQPANGNFILAPNAPLDWRSPQNANLWQGLNGINNPCPNSYRLPTGVELEAERTSWFSNNSAGAFASQLKLPLEGGRSRNDGSINDVGILGGYWSSTVSGTNLRRLLFGSSTGYVFDGSRADGVAIRCIKDASAIPATIGALNCGSSSTTGTLSSGTAASGVSTSVPYTGGNAGSYAAQTISSTGVTGLTATLSSGILNFGSGSLSLTISGTPSANGSATFPLSIGGQTCSFTLTVQPNLAAQYPSNSVFCASGPTDIVDVTNPITGKIWMDRNLGATQAATSSTDAAAYGDLYQWGRRSDGHQCRTSATTSSLSSLDQPTSNNFILHPVVDPMDWRSPQNSNLWQGINGVNNPCPAGYRVPTETEWNNERLSWNTSNAQGANSSILHLPQAGRRNHANGNLGAVGTLGVYWTSTAIGLFSQKINISDLDALLNSEGRATGLSIRCIKEAIGSIGYLDCGGATLSGNLIIGIEASNVSLSVPYTAGNGGFYAAQSVASTGITGLTATISQGLFATGSGFLIFAISGTPSSSGTASFALTIGGQTCSYTVTVQTALAAQYPAGSVFCASGPTTIVDVTNPNTGKTWMDRNLGASQAATSLTDAAAYGDLYQWGRRADGHQCRNSATTNTLSSSDQPNHGNFIIAPTNPQWDWRSPQNSNLWQGVNGVNNPCPIGYRLPTQNELESERLSWNSNNAAGAYNSPLKLTLAGSRTYDGGIWLLNSQVFYWTSTFSGNKSFVLDLYGSSANMAEMQRGPGNSIRCIKN